ncbi:MAG: murein L,D-transpeptidase catalytic domain-containing protein [Ferruginibacter sp.]
MKIFAALLLIAATVSITVYFSPFKSSAISPAKHLVKPKPSDDEDARRRIRLKQKASILAKYSSENGFNSTHCFIMDMSIASGKKRFFVYNLKKDSVEFSGLVAHGSGSDATAGLYFSNTSGSNCTSLGKYKIGKPYYGTFGLAYKLHGLDKTNSNAFNRFVVLHAHACIPNNEVQPLEICRSWGCPTVSPTFLTHLQSYIDKSKKPLLLWIFQ